MAHPHNRRAAIGSNIKMYLSLEETRAWLAMIRDLLVGWDALERFFFPTAPALWLAQQMLAGTGIGYGAQNMHWEDTGPYTGEISPRTLKELGCTHVELGHSERRLLFGETDEAVARKVETALRHGLRPVLCFGEHERTVDPRISWPVVTGQLEIDLARVPVERLGEIVLAYEPSWAIGKEEAAPSAYVAEMHGRIRQWLRQRFGAVAQSTLIVYGGSVTPSNAPALLAAPDVDGLFVGRAALRRESFSPLVDAVMARVNGRGHP